MCLSRIIRWGTWDSSDAHILLASPAQASARNKLGSPWSRESCPVSRATMPHSTHFVELCYPWSHATHSSFSGTPFLIAYATPISPPGISGFDRASLSLYPELIVWVEAVISKVSVWICGSKEPTGRAEPGDLSDQMALSNPSYATLLTWWDRDADHFPFDLARLKMCQRYHYSSSLAKALITVQAESVAANSVR